MKTFSGTYSPPNQPGTDAQLEVTYYNVKLITEDRERVWNVENISVAKPTARCVVSFSDGGIFTTSDLSLNDVLLDYFPKSHLHPSPGKQFISPPVLLFLGIFVLVLLGVVLFYFYGIPAIGNYAGKHIPIKMEEKIGKQMFDAMKGEWKIDTERTEAVNELFRHINDNKDYNFYITVVKDKTVNAFAMPGGNIVVYDEIIRRMKTPEELAALLTHESSHITCRHTSRTMCTNLANYVFFSAILGDISGVAAVLVQNADQIKTLTYSRDLETEADLMGLELMYRKGINPNGMLHLMETLKAESKNHPSEMPEFLSTHPLPDSRLNYVAENIAKHKYNTEADSTLLKLWDRIKL